MALVKMQVLRHMTQCWLVNSHLKLGRVW